MHGTAKLICFVNSRSTEEMVFMANTPAQQHRNGTQSVPPRKTGRWMHTANCRQCKYLACSRVVVTGCARVIVKGFGVHRAVGSLSHQWPKQGDSSKHRFGRALEADKTQRRDSLFPSGSSPAGSRLGGQSKVPPSLITSQGRGGGARSRGGQLHQVSMPRSSKGRQQ